MNIKHKKINYIAEINLNSKSAYKHQVLKMCDAFSETGYDVTLFVINKNKITFKTLKKKCILKSNFKIKQVYNNILKLNFFLRVWFAFKILYNIRNTKAHIYSRSVLTSILLSIFGFKNNLEIHQPNSGFTYFLFNLLKLKKFSKNIKYILIHKNLNKIFSLNKNSFLVAEDAVDLSDFKKKIKVKHLNACVYTGSLFPGKGIELIIQIAKKIKNLKFHIYGDLNTTSSKIIDQCKNINNINFFGHVDYFKIPKILKSYKIILMPYSNKVYGNHKNMNISNYMSPLKLFDYLAAGRIIIASKHKNYSHILKNKKNALLCDPSNVFDWKKMINKALSKKFNHNQLVSNSIKTVRCYTWKLRVLRIIKFIN